MMCGKHCSSFFKEFRNFWILSSDEDIISPKVFSSNNLNYSFCFIFIPRVITVSENPSEVIKQCNEVLERIIGDDSVPRNIRRSADNIKNVLSNEKQPVSKERLW